MPAIMLCVFLGSEYATAHTEGRPERGDTKRGKMKRQKRNKKATASANAAAGSRLNPAWFEEVNAELLKLVNEAD